MQLITCHAGKLHTLSTLSGLKNDGAMRAFKTGLEAIDALAPDNVLSRGAVHELLFDPVYPPPGFVAALFARSASHSPVVATPASRSSAARNRFATSSRRDAGVATTDRSIIWSDPRGEIYPPALAALGFDLTKVYLLHSKSAVDESWAVTECLRCRGVGVVIASPGRLSRIEARRLQLAAERGGSVGLLLRPTGRGAGRPGRRKPAPGPP